MNHSVHLNQVMSQFRSILNKNSKCSKITKLPNSLPASRFLEGVGTSRTSLLLFFDAGTIV